MTANRRIFLNIVASYGRSLFAMACGLFSTRWVLMALGQTDMGLYSVVGSLVMMIAFFNIQFAMAISRFFAYAIGQAKVTKDASAGLEECRRWFNVAVSIHTILPLVLVVIGYPIGAYLIENHYLVIPTEKVESCLWVWRFSCLSCFVGMVNVPFQGMYTAKQYIAELTIYNVFQTAARTLIVYLMAIHPGEWLTKYAFAMMMVSVVPQVIICWRALVVFPECRFVGRYLWAPGRVRQVAMYVIWQVVGSLGFVARTTGVAVIVNRFFGPNVNAAMGVGNNLATETSVLTGALSGAFSPAITTAYGAGDMTYMRNMAYRTCKFGTLLTLMFALPLSLEVNEVLVLWLKNPPTHTAELCLSLMVCIVLEKLTLGHTLAVNASGKLARYQTIHGIALSTVLPVGVIACLFSVNVWSIGVALMSTMVVSMICDVLVARRSVGLSPWYWLTRILLPVVLVSIVTLAAGSVVCWIMTPSFLRVILTSLVSLVFFAMSSWLVALSQEERAYIKSKITSVHARIVPC